MKQQNKILIFDSSSVITLALNNLLYILKKLKEEFKIKFIITQPVKNEIIDKPLKIKKYELEALMIKQLIKNSILETPICIGIENDTIEKETQKVMRVANKIFSFKNTFIKIISKGEASCFALAKFLKKQVPDVTVVIDERTARMLVEKPENLHKLLERKLHKTLEMQKYRAEYFKGIKIIRSSEICYIAYKRNLVNISNGQQVLEALLYATKFRGCAISTQEIEEMKRLV